MALHKIYNIPILPLGMVNAYLIQGPKGLLLVDTGLPGSEVKIKKLLHKLKLTFTDIKLIVITHGHIDHAGSAYMIRELSGAPVLLHKKEIDYCSGKVEMPFYPTGLFGRFFKMTGAIQQPYQYFKPDVVIESEEFDLSNYGIGAKVCSTPGHTPGSISVCLNDGRVIAGDLAASGILLGGIILKSRVKRPPFEEAPLSVANSLEKLLNRGMKEFYLGHGGPLTRDKIKSHIKNLRQIG